MAASASRKRLLDKLAALRAKTTGAGCTEAEAMAAAALAAELMTKHGIDEVELVMTTATAPEKTEGTGWQGDLVGVICYCTNSAAMLTGGAWNFVGREPGPDIAAYLRNLTVRAVERELRDFKTKPIYRRKRKLSVKRDLASEFRAGMVNALKRRLLEVFGPGVDAEQRRLAGEARDKIFGQGQAVDIRRRDLKLGDGYFAGRRAGADVALHHGVAGAPSPKQIGAS
jgi:hypothetical protein